MAKDFDPGTATVGKSYGINLDVLSPRLDTEAEFQAALFKLARAEGWLCYHTHDSRRSAAGFPDAVMIHRERRLMIVAELKVGDNKTTPEQLEWLNAFSDVGVVAVEWRPESWEPIAQFLKGTSMLNKNFEIDTTTNR